MRTPGTAQELERVRMIAANMFERQASTRQIAADLGVDDQTIRAWRRLWKKGGREALKSRPHPGRPCELSGAQKDELIALLAEAPTAYGFDRHFWTTAMIAELIKQRFGVAYHRDWVGEVLHALGLSWQKPMRRSRERDEAKINAWRHEQWPAILKKVSKPTA